MKKYLFIIMVLAFAITSYGQAVNLLSDDFSGGIAANWTTNSNNWIDDDFNGNPDEAAEFNWNPNLTNYDNQNLVSATWDVDGALSLTFTFDLSLNDFNANGSEHLDAEVFDGAAWVSVATFANNGDIDWATHAIDATAFANADFAVRFRAHGSDNFDIDHWYIDNVSVDVVMPAAGGGGAADCHLDCPGDIEKTLGAGECSVFAEYDARTEGDCATDYDSILVMDDAINGFNGVLDPTEFPEWDLSGAMFFSQGTMLNGPAAIYNTQVSTMIALSADHQTLKLEGYDEFSTCPGNGTDANFNYTFVSFIAPFDGTVTFDWSYHNDDDWGPDWDPAGYFHNGFITQLSQDGGPDDQNRAGVTIDVLAGEEFGFYVSTDDFDECGSAAEITNFSLVPAPASDGIYLTSGPALGESLGVGEYTVELTLFNNGQEVDKCDFEIKVHPFSGATTTLYCNDESQVSVNENCEATITAENILEDAAYGCYDDYRVEIFSSMPANVAGAIGDVDNPAPLGNYIVGIYDDKTGNNCWSRITVMDKIAPTIECACPVGGEYPEGAVIPEYIFKRFTTSDNTIEIDVEGWDFGDQGLVSIIMMNFK